MKEIIIQTNADFTPKGKRTAKLVKHAMNGKKIKPVIRCYVGRSAYMEHPVESYKLVNEWLSS